MVATVNTIENACQEQFQVFVEERFVNRKKEATDVIKLNKFALFSNPRTSSTKKKQDVASLKQNCYLFSQLYISCKVRQGNLKGLKIRNKRQDKEETLSGPQNSEEREEISLFRR